MPENNCEKEERLLLYFNENEVLTSIEVVHHLYGLDVNSDYNKTMIGAILNESNIMIALIYYHVRHGDEGEPGLNLLKAVQVFMADRIVQNILKKIDKHPIKVGYPAQEFFKMDRFPFEEIFKMDGNSIQVVNCYFHIFKGYDYLNSRLGYLEKDKFDKMSSRCYKFIYEIEKIPFSKFDKKAYDEYCNTGCCNNYEVTDSQHPSQAGPVLCKKSFATGKEFKGHEVAVACSETKLQTTNVQAKTKQISSYITGLIIGFLFDLSLLEKILDAIFHPQ